MKMDNNLKLFSTTNNETMATTILSTNEDAMNDNINISSLSFSSCGESEQHSNDTDNKATNGDQNHQQGELSSLLSFSKSTNISFYPKSDHSLSMGQHHHFDDTTITTTSSMKATTVTSNSSQKTPSLVFDDFYLAKILTKM